MTGKCLCGAVSVTVNANPEFIHDCNCGLCRKTGAAWGYYSSTSATTSGPTVAFVRQDKGSPAVEIHSCESCATTTHFVLTELFKAQNPSVDQLGINMKLFDPRELQGVEVRFPDGLDWTGEGPFGYRRAPMTISDRLPW